jgi:cell division septation protein DedD
VSDSSESYYYEIALTNRQVLVSFVVLLASVLLAFGAGVWVGRMGQGQALAAELPPAASDAEEPSDLAGLEEFQFPSDEAAGRLRKPDLSQLRGPSSSPPPPASSAAPPPSTATTLAEDVGSAPPPQTAPPASAAERPAASPPEPEVRSPPPSPPPPPRAAPPPPAASAAVPAGEGFVVQVFATREEVQAEKVRDQLRRKGYEAFISSVLVGSLSNYRVRVGPFATRDPAERAAREITAEFKLETWVTAASN